MESGFPEMTTKTSPVRDLGFKPAHGIARALVSCSTAKPAVENDVKPWVFCLFAANARLVCRVWETWKVYVLRQREKKQTYQQADRLYEQNLIR